MNSNDALDYSAELIRTFVDRTRRARYLTLLESGAKGRVKLRRALPHFSDLDERYVRPIPAGSQSPDTILQMLRDLGAPKTCYIMAESDDLDDREMPLELALDSVVASGMGALLSCIPGRLAYFEGESAGDRGVLYRPAV